MVQYTLIFNVAGLKNLNTKKKEKKIGSTKVKGCFSRKAVNI